MSLLLGNFMYVIPVAAIVVVAIVFLALRKPENRLESKSIAIPPTPTSQAKPTPVPDVVQPAPPIFPRAVERAPVTEAPVVAQKKALSSALTNTRTSFFGRLKSLVGAKEVLSSSEMEELEEILYTSDLGPQTVQRLLGAVELKMKSSGAHGFESVRVALKDEMLEIFAAVDKKTGAAPSTGDGVDQDLEQIGIYQHQPAIIMVVGVNGAGKTTTIGKLACRIAKTNRKVLVAAGDTFRAAAGEQLKIWTERAQVEIFNPEGVADPSAVAYAALERAGRDFNVVIIDTAGRLHTQKNLMEELKKMKRVIATKVPGAPHEILLVLDANSGQNALLQAKEFNLALGVTGVVLTKLDGTAKGGVAVGLACELGLPIKLIGVGEGLDDLRRFSSREFVDSIM
jgi:fused signal recognition particle receptor